MTKIPKYLVVASLLLAVSTAAMAAPWSPLTIDYRGPVIFKTNDVSSGTLYSDPNDITSGSAGPGSMTGEDGWGLLQVMQINIGKIIGVNDIASTTSSLWSNPPAPPPPGRELFGVYWNVQDTKVSSGGGLVQVTESVGLYFAIWEQDAGTAAAVSTDLGWAGTAGRGLPWEYDRIGGYDPNGLGSTGSPVLWLTGKSTAMGLLGTLAGTEYLAGTDLAGGTGFAETYMEVADLTTWVDPNGTTVAGPGKGLHNALFNSNYYVGPGPAGGGANADLYLKMTTSYPGDYDWTISSDDDIGAIAIPEPITVMAVFLGISSLGGYVRKRTRV